MLRQAYLSLVREVIQKASEIGRPQDHHSSIDLYLEAFRDTWPYHKDDMASDALFDFSEYPLLI